MTADAAIELSNVVVEADDRRILGPIDLVVDRGAYVVVVGPSGSGKTTLLRAIAGLARPSSGRVSLEGVIAGDGARVVIPPHARRIGFVFQGGGLWPHMSVARTLDFVLSQQKVARTARSRKIAELLEWVELVGLDERMPGTLSGGEMQRLALARALATDPSILLLDEPLGPLDVELRESLVSKLAALRERSNLTILHVTHDPEEVAALSTCTLRLERGCIVPTPKLSAVGGNAAALPRASQ